MPRTVRTAVVVDDEEGARLDLVALLDREPRVRVIGQAATVDEAARLVRRERPDLVFLDIRLGGRSGFDLLNAVEEAFDVIFVTAWEEHAVRAFEVDAVDYLLKPVEPERLTAAIERLDRPSAAATMRPREIDDWLFLPLEGGRGFLPLEAISHVTAAGDYTLVHSTDGRRHMVLKTMREWEERLPRARFLRIHRAAIVNLMRVARVEPWSNHTYRVFLNGVRDPLTMSRTYARRAERLLG